MTCHNLIACCAALLTLTACQLDLKNIGTPDSASATLPTTEDGESTDTADTADTAEPTSTTDASSTTGEPTGTTSAETTGPTVGPDPAYDRECQADDFVCDDWGCENGDDVRLGECYKPCTPGVIGEPDPECDEPERPFCSQVGRSFGGDFDCNGCQHICVSAAINQCDLGIAECQ